MRSELIIRPGSFHGTDRVLDTIEAEGTPGGTLGGVPAIKWKLVESPFDPKTRHWRGRGRGCGKECECSGPRLTIGGEPVQMIEPGGLVMWTYAS